MIDRFRYICFALLFLLFSRRKKLQTNKKQKNKFSPINIMITHIHIVINIVSNNDNSLFCFLLDYIMFFFLSIDHQSLIITVLMLFFLLLFKKVFSLVHFLILILSSFSPWLDSYYHYYLFWIHFSYSLVYLVSCCDLI